ncbi:MAG: hypothetical protein LBQ19_04085 [Synergistaceae bacterium]|jgi:hypothetical protein|nr:hypothetical protein [Synergistaceae bacterium]
MRIRLDDIELKLDDTALDGKGTLLDAVKRIALDGGGVIMDIIVDGELVTEEAFLSLSGGVDIRFVSQAIRELAPETLSEGDRYLSILGGGLEDVATLFEQRKEQEALSRFSECVEGIDWLLAVFGKCCLLFAMSPDSFKSGGYGDFIACFNATQKEILTCMEGGKNMRVAFLIREELIPLIDRFSGFWREVKEHAETPLQ